MWVVFTWLNSNWSTGSFDVRRSGVCRLFYGIIPFLKYCKTKNRYLKTKFSLGVDAVVFSRWGLLLGPSALVAHCCLLPYNFPLLEGTPWPGPRASPFPRTGCGQWPADTGKQRPDLKLPSGTPLGGHPASETPAALAKASGMQPHHGSISCLAQFCLSHFLPGRLPRELPSDPASSSLSGDCFQETQTKPKLH